MKRVTIPEIQQVCIVGTVCGASGSGQWYMGGQQKDTRLNSTSERISLPKSGDFILKAVSLKCFKPRRNCGHIFIFKGHSFISVENGWG